jgi:hypothetical protein
MIDVRLEEIKILHQTELNDVTQKYESQLQDQRDDNETELLNLKAEMQ